jgi:predicted RNA binding protein YcfA (HicA-like mRNA interferase family)
MRYHFHVSAAGKILRKMRRNPTGWRIDELQAVANESGVGWRRPGHGGSHVIFSASGVREIVSVPAKRPIKPVYIRQFLALIDNAVEVNQNEHKDRSKS